MWLDTIYKCWNYPSQFTISRQRRFHIIIGHYIGSVVVGIIVTIRSLSDLPQSIDYFNSIEFYFLAVLVILSLTVGPWWLFNMAPGEGWVYIPELGEYIDDEWAAVWYEEQLQLAYRNLSYHEEGKDEAERAILYYKQRVVEKNQDVAGGEEHGGTVEKHQARELKDVKIQ